MLRIAIAVAVVLVSQLQEGTALAANPVTDLTVTQNEGYATLAWTPVAGASDYQVERTVVNADGSLGTATITGVWQAQRTITPAFPRFADAGFALGGTYQWRVRARFGTTPQDFSAPVVQTTRPQWGSGPGASLRTQWETSGNATTQSGRKAERPCFMVASQACGKNTRNVVPPPGVDCTSMSPSCICTVR